MQQDLRRRRRRIEEEEYRTLFRSQYKIDVGYISDNLVTNPNQFGFKPKHNTEMCIFALKEAILKYRALNSNVYSCFLDASKAFDRVNHSKLFDTLVKRGVRYNQNNSFLVYQSDNVGPMSVGIMSCRAGLKSLMECVKVEFYPRTYFVYMLTNLAEC